MEYGCGFPVCSSTSKSNTYNPGGVMQLVAGPMVSRHIKSGSDAVGRYAWSKFGDQAGNKVCIISSYRVVQRKGTPIISDSNTAYKQQVEQLLRQGKTAPDPRQQVLRDLSGLMADIRNEGYEVLVMMDANESNSPGSTLHSFVKNNYLHDAHENIAERPRTTRIGSSTIIDYMFATEGLLQFIRGRGYRPLHEGLDSDHVMLWADIAFDEFFGSAAPAMAPSQRREFNNSNTLMRDSFLGHLKNNHAQSRLPDRIRKLELEIKIEGSNPYRVRKYNSLDKEMVDSIKAAAKKTARTNRGYARSPELTKARDLVSMWKSILTSARHDIPITERAQSLADRHDIELGYHVKKGDTIRKLQRYVTESWTHLKACRAKDRDLRGKWLGSLARYKASEEDDKEASKILKEMVRNLHDRQMHQKLTHMVKGAHVGLDYIEVPTAEWYYSPSNDELYHYDNGVFEAHAPDRATRCHHFVHHVLKVVPDDAVETEVVEEPEGIRRLGLLGRPISWRQLRDKETMERHLLRRNKRHLQQVAMEECPPRQSYFEDILSEFGTSDAADDLLDGDTSADLSRFPPIVRAWLRQFSTDDGGSECTPITGMIHIDEFQAAFRSVREKTSSSPSGIHYTFWKAIASDSEISSYMVIMMRLPFMYGFKNDRWAKSLDVMLEKKPGVRRIHQLRIIGLVEG
ncbi:hypothetical protein ACHAWF_003332, partial [Thalassiosira exigua]